MKSTVEHLNPTRVKLSVEVPFDELKPHFDKAYGALSGQVRIPGFRPGKVPPRILDARLGRGAILSEVVNDAIPAKYGQAVSESALTPLGQPEIEVTRIDDGDTLAFTAEVDVRPEFDLPDASQVTVEIDDVEIEDSEIEEQVDALRERFATVTEVDRPAADGDLVTIDLRASIAGEPLEDATADGLSYRIGTKDLVDGLDEALIGLSKGESKDFTTKLVAGEHAGEEADVTVSVGAVSERSLPEVDDEFAQLASEFDTVEETASGPDRADPPDQEPEPRLPSAGQGARGAAGPGRDRRAREHCQDRIRRAAARCRALVRPRRGGVQRLSRGRGTNPGGIRRGDAGSVRRGGPGPVAPRRDGRAAGRDRFPGRVHRPDPLQRPADRDVARTNTSSVSRTRSNCRR